MIDFPAHKGELQLTHNPHKSFYESLEEYLRGHDWFDFIGPENKERCIKTNEIWILRWYPETPVGFTAMAAPTLEELLAICLGNDGDSFP